MSVRTVFESTNMSSTKYHGRIFDCIATEDIENGTFGYIDELADGYDVVYNFHKGYKAGKTVVVVDQPVWSEDTSRMTNQRKDKFIVENGTVFRVREVKKNNEFAISAEGFTPATVENVDVDKYVTIDETTGKLVVGDSVVESAIMNGKIMRKRVMGNTLVTAAHNYGYSRVMYEVKVESLA